MMSKLEGVPNGNAKRAKSVPKRVHFAEFPIIIEPKPRKRCIPENFVVNDEVEESESEVIQTEEVNRKYGNSGKIIIILFAVFALIIWIIYEEAERFETKDRLSELRSLEHRNHISAPIHELFRETKSDNRITSILMHLRPYIPVIFGICIVISFIWRKL